MDKNKPLNVWQIVNIAWELGYTIAIPVLVFAIGGAYLDKKLGTLPLFLILGLVISLFVSGFCVYKKVKQAIKS